MERLRTRGILLMLYTILCGRKEYIREEEAIHKADILSQRGRHPTIVSKVWGCALNTGILFLRNSHRMDKFFEDVWKITNRK